MKKLLLSVFIILSFLSANIVQAIEYKANPKAANQSAVSAGSLASLSAAIGTTKKATIVLGHTSSGTTTDYIVGSNLNLSAYTNITYMKKCGARLSHSTYTISIPNFKSECDDQAFSGTGAVSLLGNLAYVDPDWWYPGTGEWSVAINAAIAASKTATNMTPTVRLKSRTYQLSASIMWSTHVNLVGAGVGSTLLDPDAGVFAIQIGYVSPGARFSTISDLSIYGGAGGLKFSGGAGSYILHLILRNLYIDKPTENCILIDDMDIQNSIFDNVRTYGGLRGMLIKGISSSNRNTWLAGEFTAAQEAGVELDGSAVTYTIAGPLMINTVIENNEKYGLVMRNVNVGFFPGLHLEGNGTNVVGGPYANILLYGKSASLTTGLLTFDTMTNVASGANQGGLALQVKDRYVRGPIYFRNCLLRPTDIVDLGTALNVGMTEYTAFVNEGMYPITVQGDTMPVHNVSENMIVDGSFEQYGGATASSATGWSLYGAGASAVQVAGTYSPYAVRFTGVAAGQNFRQLGMLSRLKPNTLYLVRVKYSMDESSTSGFNLNFINNNSVVAAVMSETIAVGGTGWLIKRALIRTPAALTGVVGFQFNQSAAGTVILDIDDMWVTEGFEAFEMPWSRYDIAIERGVQAIPYATEITPALSLGSVVNVTIPAIWTGAMKINNPTDYIIGQTFSVRFTCLTLDPSCDLTYGTVFKNVVGAASVTVDKSVVLTFVIMSATEIILIGDTGEF